MKINYKGKTYRVKNSITETVNSISKIASVCRMFILFGFINYVLVVLIFLYNGLDAFIASLYLDGLCLIIVNLLDMFIYIGKKIIKLIVAKDIVVSKKDVKIWDSKAVKIIRQIIFVIIVVSICAFEGWAIYFVAHWLISYISNSSFGIDSAAQLLSCISVVGGVIVVPLRISINYANDILKPILNKLNELSRLDKNSEEYERLLYYLKTEVFYARDKKVIELFNKYVITRDAEILQSIIIILNRKMRKRIDMNFWIGEFHYLIVEAKPNADRTK